jgi:hypothetical protein
MNKILTFLMLITLLSCKKEVPAGFDNGWIRCQVNNEEWEGQAAGNLIDFDTVLRISIRAVEGKYKWGKFIPETRLSLFNLPLNLGKHHLKKDFQDGVGLSIFSVLDGDFDVACEKFYPDATDSLNNWIEITEEDDDFSVIRGNFNITTVSDGSCDGAPPSSMEISKGSFEVRLKD